MTIDCSRKGCVNAIAKKLQGRSCFFVAAYCLLELISFLILVTNPQLFDVLQGPSVVLAKKNNRQLGEQTTTPLEYPSMTLKMDDQMLEIKQSSYANNPFHIELPPLEELIDSNGNVIGDISWMLDFAIIAFPKAGTTFVSVY